MEANSLGLSTLKSEGDKYKLDCSSARDIQKYNIDHLTNRFGRLPLEYYTQTVGDLGKYYCDTTYIFFDDNKIEPNHTDLLIPLSSKDKDYEITLNCLATVAPAVDIVISAFCIQNYKFNSDYTLNQVGEIDVSEYAI